MLVGNLLALKQNSLKRLLAYSSIAHLGYLLITLVVYGHLQQPHIAVEATNFYLSAYVITSLAAFGLLSILASPIGKENALTDPPDTDQLDQLRGLFWRQPLLALLLTIAMLSLAGIPLTVGFIGKFYLFTAGISAELWVLLGALVIGSGIGIYYYLRVVFAMTAQATGDESATNNQQLTSVAILVVWILIVGMLYLGIFPQSFIEYLAGVIL